MSKFVSSPYYICNLTYGYGYIVQKMQENYRNILTHNLWVSYMLRCIYIVYIYSQDISVFSNNIVITVFNNNNVVSVFNNNNIVVTVFNKLIYILYIILLFVSYVSLHSFIRHPLFRYTK